MNLRIWFSFPYAIAPSDLASSINLSMSFLEGQAMPQFLGLQPKSSGWFMYILEFLSVLLLDASVLITWATAYKVYDEPFF
jgi:hypothetical protein